MTPKQCIKCDHPMRAANVPGKKAPGTRQHSGKGLCKNCYWRARKDAGLIPQGPVELLPVFDERLAASALECYLVERRRRLATA